MSDSDLDPGIVTFVDQRTKAESAVIGLLARREFARARLAIPDLNVYSDYEQWREIREGFQMGLAMAGVDVKMVTVALKPFLAWLGLTGRPASERALDAFAASILAFRSTPQPMVLAVIDEKEFAAHARHVAALSIHRDYREWLRDRQALRIEAAALGLPVEELPVQVGRFAEWSACVGQIAEAPIDRYAELMLEHLARYFDE